MSFFLFFFFLNQAMATLGPHRVKTERKSLSLSSEIFMETVESGLSQLHRKELPLSVVSFHQCTLYLKL